LGPQSGNASAWLLRAGRGDLTWRRPFVTVTLRVGPTENTTEIPENSVAYTVMRDGKRRLIPDVRQEPDYFECHRETISEVAIPLTTPGEAPSQIAAIGVLNVEWFAPYPVHPEDASNLEHLWNLVSPSVEAMHERATLTDLLDFYKSHAGFRGDDGVLDAALARIESLTGFDSGAIWLLDPAGTHLECGWARTPGGSKKYDELSLDITGGSFAASVFRDGDSKCSADDPRIDHAAHRALRAKGEITGVRLKYGEGVSGVVTVWPARSSRQISTRCFRGCIELRYPIFRQRGK